QEDERIILEVSDNGAGLPDHLRERIFDPFFTTKDVGAGSGLGLAIVRTLLERHGGTIKVESIEGQGATFVVSLVKASTTR
ncbi:MAG: phosphate starvation-inducible protein PsiE, partial [Gemmatimonadetes bacterium]|nr:phosphate starvation-inducible protein PsiE [Gemmatimonadota bacterium]